jgi:hypothetical protein
LRQRSASLDRKSGNKGQLASGSGDARPIFDGNAARLAGAARSASARVACPIFDGKLLLHRRGDGDASEHKKCRPLLRSEGHVAFVHKDDLAPRINRVGIENLLILFATRAAGR